jgi:hypothetical protein
MNDHFLSTFKKEPPEAFSRKLYQHLLTMERKKRRATQSFTLAGVMLLLIITITLLVSPAVRVYAQEWIHQLGNLFLSNQPTYAEQFETQIQNGTMQETTQTGTVVPWQPPQQLSVAEASQKAGFTVAVITALPAKYDLLVRDVTLPNKDTPYTLATTTYRSGETTIVLVQHLYDPSAAAQTLPVGEAGIEEVLVSGEKGYWITKLRLSTYVNEDDQVEPMYANLLVWEKDGFEFRLQSTPGLPLDKIIAYAESLSD